VADALGIGEVSAGIYTRCALRPTSSVARASVGVRLHQMHMTAKKGRYEPLAAPFAPRTSLLRTPGVSGDRYGAGEGLGATEAEADAPADAEADAPADPLGAAEKLGNGLGVGDGNSVVGTLARERAKIRMKMTRTTRTHGRASVSLRGGSAPRYPADGSCPRAGPPRL
jgi:hypothetical protein